MFNREQDCNVVIAFLMSPSLVRIRRSNASLSRSLIFSDEAIISMRVLIASSERGLNLNFAQREVIGSMMREM